ncbi:hypothetical protein CRG98_019347 [Punica granatum]|uniref:Uncharacterized protein n=1 Tax=Punica granatum TaxID=22663 RepID=A0A2I0JVL3_PUNGR|nr:hypothetical protein CRG98_019347 [Punica granatum]
MEAVGCSSLVRLDRERGIRDIICKDMTDEGNRSQVIDAFGKRRFQGGFVTTWSRRSMISVEEDQRLDQVNLVLANPRSESEQLLRTSLKIKMHSLSFEVPYLCRALEDMFPIARWWFLLVCYQGRRRMARRGQVSEYSGDVHDWQVPCLFLVVDMLDLDEPLLLGLTRKFYLVMEAAYPSPMIAPCRTFRKHWACSPEGFSSCDFEPSSKSHRKVLLLWEMALQAGQAV